MSGSLLQPGAIAEGLKLKDLREPLGLCLKSLYNRYGHLLQNSRLDPKLLTPEDRHLLWKYEFRKAAEAAGALAVKPAPATESSGQLDLLPKTDEDRRLQEQILHLHEIQIPAVMAWVRAVKPTLNHDHIALGHPTLTSYIRTIAAQLGVSEQTFWRKRSDYLKNEDICVFANERPGPKATGFGSIALDASMRAHVRECWEIEKLTRAQTYASLLGYLKDKQRGCGAAWVYPVPSSDTVTRFINVELRGAMNPWRRGPDAVKAWAGHANRSYRNLPSLGQVVCDENRINLLGFEPRHADRVQRFWLVTIFDTRSIYPLTWELLGAADGATKLHGITQRDEQRLFVRMVTEYGVPDSFYSDRGRFRGSFWGGEPGARAKRRDEQFVRSDGILDSLGIKRRMPREKNPRGSRLERCFRFVADKCRLEPGWIGANDQERKTTPGDRHAAEHAEFIAGRRATTPLLTKDQILEHINGWMKEWCEHPSDGTDMDGLSPRAVFLRNMPAGGFRKLHAAELELIRAEWYANRIVKQGGIVELPDGTHYGKPGEITELQGMKRNIVRLPDDKSFVMVKGLRKGEPDMVAHLRPRLGMDDPNLSQWIEGQQRVQKIGEARLGAPSPASNTAEILEPYHSPMPARQRPRFADDVARDLLKTEDSDASAS